MRDIVFANNLQLAEKRFSNTPGSGNEIPLDIASLMLWLAIYLHYDQMALLIYKQCKLFPEKQFDNWFNGHCEINVKLKSEKKESDTSRSLIFKKPTKIKSDDNNLQVETLPVQESAFSIKDFMYLFIE